MSINLMNIIITHAYYKKRTLIGYITERVSILHAIIVSVLCCLGKRSLLYIK